MFPCSEEEQYKRVMGKKIFGIVHQYECLVGQIAELKLDNLKTNLSLNSPYKTYLAISSQVHWYNKLRICEQIIVKQLEILREFFCHNGLPFEEGDESQVVENLSNKIRSSGDIFLNDKLKDNLDELRIACQEKEKIIKENKNIFAELTAEEIKHKYSKEAHLAEMSHKFMCTILSSVHGLPYEIIDFLTCLPDEDRKMLVKNLNEGLREFEQIKLQSVGG